MGGVLSSEHAAVKESGVTVKTFEKACPRRHESHWTDNVGGDGKPNTHATPVAH